MFQKIDLRTEVEEPFVRRTAIACQRTFFWFMIFSIRGLCVSQTPQLSKSEQAESHNEAHTEDF